MIQRRTVTNKISNKEVMLKSNLIEYPRLCPRCNVASKPDLMGIVLVQESKLEITFYCESCKHQFISEYTITLEDNREYSNKQYIRTSNHIANYPVVFEQRVFSDEINSISENFVIIYNQANEAESLKLDQIAGIGFRKSLEFLVKDYSINYLGKDKDEVSKKLLAKCIEDYIQNPKVKEVLKVATWIGNDETHYVRKYSNSDVETLKNLIDLSVLWIQMDIQSGNVLASLQPVDSE